MFSNAYNRLARSTKRPATDSQASEDLYAAADNRVLSANYGVHPEQNVTYGQLEDLSQDLFSTQETDDYKDNTKLNNLEEGDLLLLGNVIVGRMTENEVERQMIHASSETAEKTVKFYLNESKANLIHMFTVCNDCGEENLKGVDFCRKCASNNCLKYIATDLRDQLADTIESYRSTIKSTHRIAAESDVAADYSPLAWPGFASISSLDDEETIHMSIILNIDGVRPKGHTLSKLSPITGSIVDLSYCQRLKFDNIILFGIFDGPCDPSNKAINTIMEIIEGNLNSCSMMIDDKTYVMCFSNTVADQPAKRSLFGMSSGNSSSSCFYCLDNNTLYKDKGEERSETRPGLITYNDGEEGLFGFIGNAPTIQRSVLCYRSLNDLLHGFGEGLCRCIVQETFVNDFPLHKSKSKVFNQRSVSLSEILAEIRFPTEQSVSKKLNDIGASDYERYSMFILGPLGMSSYFEDIRGSILSMGVSCSLLLMYRRYFDHVTAISLDIILDAVGQLLKNADRRYMSIKNHEIFFHFGKLSKLFGSPVDYSTFLHESFFHTLLTDFNSSITNGFSAIAVLRFLRWRSFIHELERRSVSHPTDKIQRFKTTLFSRKPPISSYIRDRSSLKHEHEKLLPENVALLSKVFFESGKAGEDHLYLVGEYWNRQREADDSLCFLDKDFDCAPCVFVLSFEQSGILYSLVRKYNILREWWDNLNSQVRSCTDKNDVTHMLTILREVLKCENMFKEIDISRFEGYEIVPLGNIACKAVLVTVSGRTFAVNTTFRPHRT